MTLQDRIDWLRAVIRDCNLQGGAYRVAAFITSAYDAKVKAFRYSTAAIARELGVARSTVQTSLYSLHRWGWLEIVGKPSKGRAATAYNLIIPTATDRKVSRFENQTDRNCRGLDDSTDREVSRLTDRESGRLNHEPTGESGGCGVQPTENPGTIIKESEKRARTQKKRTVVGPIFRDSTGKPWQLTPGSMARLVHWFPNLDMDATLAKAADHCQHNPQWRRPASGMLGAIQAWCGRERSPLPDTTTVDDWDAHAERLAAQQVGKGISP